jgi:hypothetical protein
LPASPDERRREPKNNRPPPTAVKFHETAWKACGRMRLRTARRRTAYASMRNLED